MNSKSLIPVLLPVMIGAGALAGCGQDTARTLGFTRDAPDEFQVVTRAPLSMPPSLTQLPVPRPGAPRPQEAGGRDGGEGLLAPSTAFSAAAPRTASESALLAQAGPSAPAGVRRRVDEEALRLEQPNQALVDRLMFWRPAPPPGTVVDPTRETQRLRENSALGRPVEDGTTPIIQRQRTGLFGGSGIF